MIPSVTDIVDSTTEVFAIRYMYCLVSNYLVEMLITSNMMYVSVCVFVMIRIQDLYNVNKLLLMCDVCHRFHAYVCVVVCISVLLCACLCCRVHVCLVVCMSVLSCACVCCSVHGYVCVIMCMCLSSFVVSVCCCVLSCVCVLLCPCVCVILHSV